MEDNATLKPKTEWHGVFEPGDSIPQEEARNQDLGGRPIDLLVPATVRAGGELESPPLCHPNIAPKMVGESNCG
jgi:hypothetical protein